MFLQLSLFRKFFMGMCIIFPVLYFVQYYTRNREEALTYLGTVNGSLGVLSYGAPLVSVVSAIAVCKMSTSVENLYHPTKISVVATNVVQYC